MRPYDRLPILGPDFGEYRPSPSRMPERPFLGPALDASLPRARVLAGRAIRLEHLKCAGVPLGDPWRSVLAEVEAWVGFGGDPSVPCRHSAEDVLEAAGWW